MQYVDLFCAGVLLVLSNETAPDIRSIAPDLQVPVVESKPAAPGKRIKETLPGYKNTNVYHVTYLPIDWKPGATYPVIVEYTGNGEYKNRYGDVCTGRVEDSKLGYGISAGRGFIWICMPFLNSAGTDYVKKWWGDPPQFDPQPTIGYCNKAVPWICAQYGGDPQHVVLAGFSRGAIACNFIGLHSSEISKLWCAFVVFSHYDGVVDWGYPGAQQSAARERLTRLGNRPQFICAEQSRGNHSVDTTQAYMDAMGIKGNFTFCDTGFRNHNDAWLLRPSKTRSELRSWLAGVLK